MGPLQSIFFIEFLKQGFITILPHTEHFLHARYYATRNSVVRLKDKRYLFLCDEESPEELLSMDILQCKWWM